MSRYCLRPGLVVLLTSRVVGGRQYTTVDLESGANVQRWETTKITDDPQEYARAIQVRGAALRAIRRHCRKTAFGLMCEVDAEGALLAGKAEAERLVAEFNASAKFSQIVVNCLEGEIAATPERAERAQRAIVSELSGLISDMNDAISSLDPKAIRDAATKAQDLGRMLDESVSDSVDAAVKAARSAARQIVKRIEKGGEDSAIVLADIQRGALEKARITFLDLSGPAVVAGDSAPAANVARVSALEIDSEPTPEPTPDPTVEPAPEPTPAALDFEPAAPVSAPVATVIPLDFD